MTNHQHADPAGQPERWLWPHEVAELFSVHSKTINQWSRQGKLPFARTIGGHRRYPESEILALRNTHWGAAS